MKSILLHPAPSIRRSSILVVLAALHGLMVAGVFSAAAQTPPQELKRSQIQAFDSSSEIIEGACPGLLLIPNTRPNYRDEKYHEPYHLGCNVYTAVPPADSGSEPVYKRRFLVCAADREALPFTRQVARFLLLLYGERRERIRDDHSLNEPTVNVWITERVEQGLSPDTGGEEFQNQIYLYDRHRERPPIEWAREIAHEYGHYALPGISGFKAPEEWANGVLGERLFLKWIREDLRAGRLLPESVAFVAPEILDDYFGRAVWPLIRRILRDGMDAGLITRNGVDGMDYYTGLALYVDTLYGTRSLVDAMLETHSASSLTFPRASDFLTGVLRVLRAKKEFILYLPALGDGEKESTIYFYLPAGAWNVTIQGSTLSWRVPADSHIGLAGTSRSVTALKGGWRRVAYLRTPGSTTARLAFRRRE